MPLGYVLKTEQIMEYYGRDDIREAILKYGRDRKVTITTDPGILGRGGGQLGFQSADDILIMLRKALEGMEGVVPRRYPGFHGTVGRHSLDGRFISNKQIGADLVFDIDVKGNYKAAFIEGRKILDFLDSYNAPYRVKFSGGSGPHIIIPYQAFPESLSGGRFRQAHKLLFQIISMRSRAGHVDGSFTSYDHFYRIPYSLNENTGLVSLPLNREQYDHFTPSMAEVQNVQVSGEWFQEPDDKAKEALMGILERGSGKLRDFGHKLESTPPDLREVEGLKSHIEERMDRLKKLVELRAPDDVIRKEKRVLKEAMKAFGRRKFKSPSHFEEDEGDN